MDGIGNYGTVNAFLRIVDKRMVMERRSGHRVGEAAWRLRRRIGKMGNTSGIRGGREEGSVRVRDRVSIRHGIRGLEELLHVELIGIAAMRGHRRCRRRAKRQKRTDNKDDGAIWGG